MPKNVKYTRTREMAAGYLVTASCLTAPWVDSAATRALLGVVEGSATCVRDGAGVEYRGRWCLGTRRRRTCLRAGESRQVRRSSSPEDGRAASIGLPVWGPTDDSRGAEADRVDNRIFRLPFERNRTIE